jgi:hypothetical protein
MHMYVYIYQQQKEGFDQQAANGQLLREAYICEDAKLCLFTSQQAALTALINSNKTGTAPLLLITHYFYINLYTKYISYCRRSFLTFPMFAVRCTVSSAMTEVQC